ncbi:MAG: nuclear transport factor 2 family protein [Bryobacteraceae bacterium]
MNRGAAIELLDRLHLAQNQFYAGGSGSSFSQILAPSITWTIPGNSDIAGTHHGLEEVLDYFRRRRELSDRTFQPHRRDVLVGDDDKIAALVDGAANHRQRPTSLVDGGAVRRCRR